MYFYNIVTNTWLQIFPSTLPSPRANSCISFNFPILYLYGGENINGALDDLWTYDLTSQSFTLLSVPGFNPPALTSAQCSVSGSSFFLFSGQISVYDSISSNYVYFPSNNSWALITVVSDTNSQYSNTATAIMSTMAVQIGGSRVTSASPAVNIFLLSSRQYYPIGNLPVPVAGHAAVQVGRPVFVFGGYSMVSDRVVIQVGTSNLFRVDDGNFECGLGFYGENCTMCAPGYYSSDYNADTCTACVAGTYNQGYAAGYLSQCTSCSVNTYSSEVGSKYCKECSATENCPIGTAVPSQFADLVDLSTQPIPYDNQDTRSSLINTTVTEILLAAVALVFLVFLFTRKFRIFLAIDIYKEIHPRKYYEDPTATAFGGLMSLVFILIALIFVISPIVLLVVSNVTETKTLVPMVSIEDVNIVANSVNFTVVLHNFVGNCSNAGKCTSSIIQSMSGLISASFSRPYCSRILDSCMIQYFGVNASYGSLLTLNFTVIDMLIFTTQIDTTIAIDSSIPGQISAQTLSVSSPSTKVFNGLSPSVFYYYYIPSVITTIDIL